MDDSVQAFSFCDNCTHAYYRSQEGAKAILNPVPTQFQNSLYDPRKAFKVYILVFWHMLNFPRVQTSKGQWHDKQIVRSPRAWKYSCDLKVIMKRKVLESGLRIEVVSAKYVFYEHCS